MSLGQRKLITIFKTFIEKVFVPQLPKMQPSCQKEWIKFSSMISADQFNFGELQLYVDTLPGVNSRSFQQSGDKPRNKSPFFMKNRKESPATTDQGGFNPSKTFGGQRARMTFPLKDLEQPSTEKHNKYTFGKEFNKDKQDNSMSTSGLSVQSVLPVLQRLFKNFSENQNKIERIGSSIGNTYEASKQPYYYQQ